MPVTPASRSLRVLAILLAAAAWAPACPDGSPGNGDAGDTAETGDGPDGTGGDSDGDGDADGDAPRDAADAEDGAEAVFPDEHPRIYLNDANRTRLEGMLADGRAAASRFRTMVDNQLGGADVYAFRASDAALLGSSPGMRPTPTTPWYGRGLRGVRGGAIAGGEHPRCAF